MKKKNVLLYILWTILLVVLCFAAVAFEYLYVDNYKNGIIYEYRSLILCVAVIFTVAVTGLTVFFCLKGGELYYRLCLIVLIFTLIVAMLLYFLRISGFRDKIDSVEDLREFISGYGLYAVPAFIIMQVLQVVVLPIPGFVAVGAGVAMFGALMGGIYSLIGILIGSFIGFYIGRVLGYKAASWVVGKNTLDKTLKSVEGKDKVLLTVMFLFPFFPDDVLCFVAGLSSMSNLYFAVMIVITRAISVFTTSYSLDGKIIPYDTLWGLIVWAILIIAVLVLSWFIFKHGEKIENYFKKLFSKNKKSGTDENNKNN